MVSWRKSTYSDGNGGSCVEVAGAARVVLVRDTKDRDGRTLTFSAQAWRAFADQLKRRLALKSPAPTGHRRGCPRHVWSRRARSEIHSHLNSEMADGLCA
ncbi:MAG TPA: DUF397 domain-containing protein [Trebonia sp.]|jgi:hypothetical protein